MLPFHVTVGLLALVAGALALFARKGGAVHRRSGLVFVVAMLCMSASGALLALLKPEWISFSAGLLTFYLVATGWLAVQRPLEESRGLLRALMLFALATGVLAWTGGLLASGRGQRGLGVGCFIFGTIALLAALADWRLLQRAALDGAQRLTRHLWRLGLALFIANASFFLGQAKQFPAAVRQSGVLSVPVFVVLLVTVYWLLRVRRRRRPLPQRRPNGSPAAAAVQGAAPGG